MSHDIMKSHHLTCAVLLAASSTVMAQPPSPLGKLVDVGGGQRIHLDCTGTGSPTVVFEGGAGDFSVIWSLVQTGASKFTRACSYDRAGYAWSDPGNKPRTFSQLALELHAVLEKGKIPPPYVLVGQSFGGSLVRSFAERYPDAVRGMVLVDAIHEDGFVFYGGDAHHLRELATRRAEPPPRIAADSETIQRARDEKPSPPEKIEPPLDRLPVEGQRIWQWASAQPIYRMVQPLEMEWSADVAQRTFEQRRVNRALLGNVPLIVLARTHGEYAPGMRLSPDSLEHLRRLQQADLAALSTSGELRFAPHSGHNIHVEDPDFVVKAIYDVVTRARR